MSNPLTADPFTIGYLIAESWQTAEEHGWHAKPRTFGDLIALMHSELSEALEEFRKGNNPAEIYFANTATGRKPEGIPAELADLIIRVCDACKTLEIDLESALREKLAYNKGREMRHGWKRL